MRKSCQHVSRIVIQQVFMGYPIVIEGTRTHSMLVRYYAITGVPNSAEFALSLSQFRFCGTIHTHFISIKSHNNVSYICQSLFRQMSLFKCINVVNVNVNINPTRLLYTIRLLAIIS